MVGITEGGDGLLLVAFIGIDGDGTEFPWSAVGVGPGADIGGEADVASVNIGCIEGAPDVERLVGFVLTGDKRNGEP